MSDSTFRATGNSRSDSQFQQQSGSSLASDLDTGELTANLTPMSSVPCAAPTHSENTDKPAEVELRWPLEVRCDDSIKISQILQSQS